MITQNGKPAAVLVTPGEFDRLNEHARFIEAVDEGLKDAAKGRMVEDEDLTRELDEASGPLDRGNSTEGIVTMATPSPLH